MNIKSRRIRILLKGGQWSHWMAIDEFKRYKNRSDGDIKEVVIEETVSYEDAMKYLGVGLTATKPKPQKRCEVTVDGITFSACTVANGLSICLYNKESVSETRLSANHVEALKGFLNDIG